MFCLAIVNAVSFIFPTPLSLLSVSLLPSLPRPSPVPPPPLPLHPQVTSPGILSHSLPDSYPFSDSDSYPRKLPITVREDPSSIHSDTELEMGSSSRATLASDVANTSEPQDTHYSISHSLYLHTNTPTSPCDHTLSPLTTPISPCDHTPFSSDHTSS